MCECATSPPTIRAGRTGSEKLGAECTELFGNVYYTHNIRAAMQRKRMGSPEHLGEMRKAHTVGRYAETIR